MRSGGRRTQTYIHATLLALGGGIAGAATTLLFHALGSAADLADVWLWSLCSLGGCGVALWWHRTGRGNLRYPQSQVRKDQVATPWVGPLVYGALLGTGVLTLISTPLVLFLLGSAAAVPDVGAAAVAGSVFGLSRTVTLPSTVERALAGRYRVLVATWLIALIALTISLALITRSVS